MELSSSKEGGPRFSHDLQQPSLPALPGYSQDPIGHAYHMIQRQFLLQGLPWIHARQAKSSDLPLRGLDTAGLCGHFSDLGKAILCKRYGIPEDAVVSHCMMEVQNAGGGNTDDRHAFLYLPDAHLYFPSEEPYDEFIDFSSSQFAPDEELDGDHAFEGLYENLMFHGGDQGRSLCHSLFQRGAVRIEHSESGNETLKLLIASYATFDPDASPGAFWVDREDLKIPSGKEMYHMTGALAWLEGVRAHMHHIDV